MSHRRDSTAPARAQDAQNRKALQRRASTGTIASEPRRRMLRAFQRGSIASRVSGSAAVSDEMQLERRLTKHQLVTEIERAESKLKREGESEKWSKSSTKPELAKHLLESLESLKALPEDKERSYVFTADPLQGVLARYPDAGALGVVQRAMAAYRHPRADPDEVPNDPDGRTPLLLLCSCLGDLPTNPEIVAGLRLIVRELVTSGADINKPHGRTGVTPM